MDNRTVTIQRVFDYPLELVWQAWTKPEHIAHWWSPKGIETKVIVHEFVEEGKWKYLMPMPNGSEFIAEGVYKEIIEFERIVSIADFKPMTEAVEIHALFAENNGKTDFTFRVVHATEDYKIQQEKMGILNGWGSVFERLEQLLPELESAG